MKFETDNPSATQRAPGRAVLGAYTLAKRLKTINGLTLLSGDERDPK
jgi:hypothetical protein